MRIPGELSATLMIQYVQYADPAQRDIELRKLLGLGRHLWIVAGDRRERARFDTRQMEAERISSVQFFREPAQLSALARAGKLAIEREHPQLFARAAFSESLASVLAEDLARAEIGLRPDLLWVGSAAGRDWQ